MVLALLMTSTALAVGGDLDTSFGGDGIVTTNFTRRIDGSYAMAMQPDGKLVVAGGAAVDGSNSAFALARYNPDGSLDTTFGGEGKVTSNLTRYYDAAWGVAIQGDGNIVVAGDYGIGSGNSAFALLRYDVGGAPDPSFGGGDGQVVTQFTRHDDGVAGLALQADGRILVSGGAAADTNHARIALARYNADGSLDSTFGGDGKVTTLLGDWAYANGVAVQSDDKIVAGGLASFGGSAKFAAVRYNSDGTLDSTFSGDGTVITNFTGHGDAAIELGIQPDDKVVLVGIAAYRTRNAKFAVARYGTDGTLDPSFGGGDGKRTLDFTRRSDYAYGAAFQPDGKVVMVGLANQAAVVARLNADGSSDTTFSGDGKVITDITSGWDFFSQVVVQTDGKFVAAGGAGSKFAVARYLA